MSSESMCAHLMPRTVFAASATACSAALAKLTFEVPITSIIFCVIPLSFPSELYAICRCAARGPQPFPLECFRGSSFASISPDHPAGYGGRLAPSPTGLLHIGHARTFWIAAQRAIAHRGTLVLRNEDLDPQRSRPEFARAMIEDLRWLGIRWSEGPDCGGPYGPYSQSERWAHYLETWRRLRRGGFLYPCTCSRKDLALAASAPNDADDEPVYPGTCREREDAAEFTEPAGMNWRFRVPEGGGG